MNKNWPSYNTLAWTELIVSSPEQCRDEVELLSRLIFENSKTKPETLLHLGCGAGLYDNTFKKHFTVTGVDISPGMLNIAKKLNPEIAYYHDDMRTINLASQFDAVIIPESIGYMCTVKDLQRAIHTAHRHLRTGGILLIVPQLRDNFKENNFVYTGRKKSIDITVFENNHIISNTKYEATIVHLIRRKNKLEVHTDVHTIGLFPLEVWHKLFKECGFTTKKIKALNTYDKFMLEDGEYPQVIFICRKKRQRQR